MAEIRDFKIGKIMPGKRWFVVALMSLWVMPGLGASCFNLSEKICNATSGCYFNDGSCSACRGEYNNSDPTDGKTGPNSCYSFDEINLGEKRTYIDGSVEYKCDENAEPNGNQCQCMDYYEYSEGVCVPKVRELIFCSGQRLGVCKLLSHAGEYNLLVKYGVGFYRYKDDTNEAPVETNKIPEQIRVAGGNEMSWQDLLGVNRRQFLGYYESNQSDPTQPQIGRIFDSQGNFVVQGQIASKYFFEQNINQVYPRFYPQAKIKYMFRDDGGCFLVRDCELDNCPNVANYVEVLADRRVCKYDINGKLFRGWECAGMTGQLIEPGTPAAIITQNGQLNAFATVECYAKVDDCPPGHYCTENVQYDCPTGTTSKSKSSKKSQCFINKETRFCDKVGCFSLPISNGTVYYKGN